MSTVDHGYGPLDRTDLLAGLGMSSLHRFRPCAAHPDGGRVGGAASQPVPTDECFEPNLASARSDFVVGVIDTGVAIQGGVPHPWLAGHVEFDADAQDPIPGSPGLLAPDDGHGSFVTGLILRQAPSVTVRMIRAIDIPEDATMTDATVAAAIDALASDPQVKVINLSFSGTSWEPEPPKGIQQALERLDDRDVVVVAAASNNKSTDKAWPGAFERVVAVGAVDETAIVGKLPPRADFSDHGKWVDAYASGVDVLGPFFNFENEDPVETFTGWARWSGTSFATAIVAGQIARRAIEDHIGAGEAAGRVLDDGPRLMSPDFATWRHPTYVRSVDSTWPLAVS